MTSVASLVMVAQSPEWSKLGADKATEEKNMLGFAQAWAKQRYGCTAKACVSKFNSYNDFITKLKAFESIGKLGILAHSSGSTITFPAQNPKDPTAYIQELRFLSDIATALGADAPEVSTVEFLGCQVGRDPAAMWEFAVAVKADWAIAHNYLHAFAPLNIRIESNETRETLEEALDWKINYLLPNTDLDEIATHKNQSVQLWMEWFTVVRDGRGCDEVDSAERAKSFWRRSAATRLQILSEDEAQTMRFKFKAPVPVFTQVEVGPPP